MIWKIRSRLHDLASRGWIMGILNVTPDSFSDGGAFLDPSLALAHARHMIAEGADLIDVGGESTRPGAEPVPADEQIRRVIPVIQALRAGSEVLVSIDTADAKVAEAALHAGADIINDVTGLRGDPRMAPLAAESGAGVVLMHMQGTPRTMQRSPAYNDVVAEVGDFFRQSLDHALASGIDPMCVALDPGIGFGKSAGHNRLLLANTATLAAIGRPLVIGVSRKSFLSTITGSADPAGRFWPGVALTALCRRFGAHIFRVHDVKPHREALRMTEAIGRGV